MVEVVRRGGGVEVVRRGEGLSKDAKILDNYLGLLLVRFIDKENGRQLSAYAFIDK
jgi:hypothetical protein